MIEIIEEFKNNSRGLLLTFENMIDNNIDIDLYLQIFFTENNFFADFTFIDDLNFDNYD
jgi:hypothetical protein